LRAHLRGSKLDHSLSSSGEERTTYTLHHSVLPSLFKNEYNSNELENEDREKNTRLHKLHVDLETDKIKKAKTLRKETELMFRSSKMNEERVNILKESVESLALEYKDYFNENNSDDLSIDFHDHEAKNKTSIVKYLPGIVLHEV
jgi:hypothetical protein